MKNNKEMERWNFYGFIFFLRNLRQIKSIFIFFYRKMTEFLELLKIVFGMNIMSLPTKKCVEKEEI